MEAGRVQCCVGQRKKADIASLGFPRVKAKKNLEKEGKKKRFLDARNSYKYVIDSLHEKPKSFIFCVPTTKIGDL